MASASRNDHVERRPRPPTRGRRSLTVVAAIALALLFFAVREIVLPVERVDALNARSPSPTATLRSEAERTTAPPSLESASSAEPTVADEPAPELLLVRVRWRANDAPVPGREVWMLDSADDVGFFEDELRHGTAAALERHARRARTDRLGIARLPFPRGNARIVVRDAVACGRIAFSPARARDVTLFVDAPEPLHVEVRDGSDRPVAGAVVRMRALDGNGSADLPGRGSPCESTARTDAAGRAELTDAGVIFAAARVVAGIVGLDVGGARATRVELDPTRVPCAPVLLRTPATGAVVVTILEPTPQGPDARYELVAVPTRHEGEGEAYGLEARVPARAGEPAVLAPLEAGTQVLVRARRIGTVVGDGSRDVVLRLPDADGFREEITLTVDDERRRVVRMRLEDERGEPLAERSLLVALRRHEDADFFCVSRMRSDAAGSLELSLVAEEVGRTIGVGLLLESRDGSVPLGGMLELPMPRPGAILDLGAVGLATFPDVVRGFVVDAATGAPVARAAVSGGLEDALVAWTDAAGHFALRAPWIARQAVIRASKRGYVSQAVTAGDGLLRVTLRPRGGISGRLRPPPGLDVGGFVVKADTRRATPVAPDGSFEIDDITPGEIDVAIVASGTDHVVLVLEGIVVSAGGGTRDPRLADVDLAAHVGTVAIEVVDPEGRPVPGVVLSVPAQPAFCETWSERDPDEPPRLRLHGRGEILVPARIDEALELTITAPGHRTRRLSLRPGPARIVLEPESLESR